ncbi:MAG: DUF1385 domain-containing protein [Calditrichaeota bacterium]|nr:MAG: DUF1385 domain-containing protein [Calditrichota bacterium]
MSRLNKSASGGSEEQILAIGGQAVIEGVMMRSPERLATAVRRASGQIELKIQEYRSLFQRHRWLNIPVIRGAITLFEVMILGIKHLNFSADVAMRDAEAQEQASNPGKKRAKKKKEAGLSTFSAVVSVSIALVVGLALFFAFPLFAATHLFSIEREALAFNLVAGTIRIALFLGYLMLISLMKDIRRLFQYHGAEHKTIFAFEKGLELTVANVRRQPRLHPRCGTSFLVMVMLVSLLFFALVDTAVMAATGKISLLIRLSTHLPLVPIVAGLSYEAIKASARRPDHPLVRIFIAPGLALQRITTSEPDDSMIEVAIVALKAARGEDVSAWLKKEAPPVTEAAAAS